MAGLKKYRLPLFFTGWCQSDDAVNLGTGAENSLEQYADQWLAITTQQVSKTSRYLTRLCFLLVFGCIFLLLLASRDLSTLVNKMK
ncbi:hypothetical protein [Candidatus Williamhamiltonella defendens]|uniref:hypothetical protein n=1 Tax=Candidatus Williamhamiltonella defendens TaxID=138072 RepID=UPI001F1B119E|nr:hypothetical protein [Candidatus Hamiltonella defensa]